MLHFLFGNNGSIVVRRLRPPSPQYYALLAYGYICTATCICHRFGVGWATRSVYDRKEMGHMMPSNRFNDTHNVLMVFLVEWYAFRLAPPVGGLQRRGNAQLGLILK